MGILWHPAVNEDFNMALDPVEQAVRAQKPLEEIKPLIGAARDAAEAQGLKATAAALRRLEKRLADGESDQAVLAKVVNSIRRNAQIAVMDKDSVRIARPTLVYLSGFLTTDSRNDYVVGSFGRIEGLIRDRTEIRAQPDLIAWTHTDLRNLFNMAVYNTFPATRASRAGYEIGAAILMPLVADGFKRDAATGAVTGTPLAKDNAKRNLANVTLLGYSAGTITAQETYNATRAMMKQVGFNDADAADILKDVVLLSTGTVSRPSKERHRFTTVIMAASNDRLMRAKNAVWGLAGTILRALTFRDYAWKKHDKPLTITPLSDTSLFVTTSVRPSLYEWQYDKDGKRAGKRPFPPLYPAWTQRRSYHELPPYLTTDDANNQFSRIALYTLINAFNRTSAPADLLQVPENDSHSRDLQDSYRLRINTAMRPNPPAAFQRHE
jgi:hypothetical protein